MNYSIDVLLVTVDKHARTRRDEVLVANYFCYFVGRKFGTRRFLGSVIKVSQQEV